MATPDDKPDFLRSRAFKECIVVFLVAGLFGIVCFSMIELTPKRRYSRINCINNLKQVGLGLRMWAGDNDGKFPMQVYTNQDGSKGWVGSTNVFWFFLVASNEMGSPKVLLCPVETARICATGFSNLNNGNLSYFIEQNAKEGFSSTLLTGDRHLTVNRIPFTNGCYQVATQQVLGWEKAPHKSAGNIVLSDGSARPADAKGLGEIRLQQQIATNWLAIP
jgi:hypothetical protein